MEQMFTLGKKKNNLVAVPNEAECTAVSVSNDCTKPTVRELPRQCAKTDYFINVQVILYRRKQVCKEEKRKGGKKREDRQRKSI